MIKRYIVSAAAFPFLHQMATAQRGGTVAFGGEVFLCILAPLLWEVISDTAKEMFDENRR